MTRATIVGGVFSIVIVLILLLLVTGRRDLEQNVDPAVPTAPSIPPSTVAAAEAHPSFLYGRITTYDGAIYEGRLRWGGGEEAFWDNYFNGFKDENPWAVLVPLERLTEEGRPIEVFGFEIPWGERQIDLGRPFMARFGDIARIEARGDGLRGVLESGIEFDPDVRVTLKRGMPAC